MVYAVGYIVTFFACIIGTICGMGGGIIIKPVLDSTGVLSVATVTFLSGITVISMTCWNVGKSLIRKESGLELKTTTLLAFGAAVGGVLGKNMFSAVAAMFANKEMAGGVQACLLFAATLLTFIYTLNKDKLQPKNIESQLARFVLGLLLGILGAFLGIGGGPFNVAALCYFFSMPTKKAAKNSLYIVLFSQVFSLLKTVIFDTIPPFSVVLLMGMVIVSIIGSEAGRKINRRLDNNSATILLEASMVLIMGINIYNIVHFLF